MAIILPSKNIYDKQNPKVRDNVIDKIEVNAKKVKREYEEKTSISTSGVSELNIFDKEPIGGNHNVETGYYYSLGSQGSDSTMYASIARAFYIEHKYINQTIYIPIVFDNKRVTSLYTGVDENGNKNISVSIYGYVNKGTVENKRVGYVSRGDERSYSQQNDEFIYTQTETSKERISTYVIQPNISITSDGTLGLSYANETLKDDGNLTTATALRTTIGDKEYFKLELTILVGVKTATLKANGFKGGEHNISGSITLQEKGTYEEYIPSQVDITISGDTDGIVFEDDFVKVGGTTAKKVHGIDGNELMQTSNYNSQTNENAVETMYGNTLSEYAKGKETATIRCSIADYYENGSKVIAIDNSTNKMCFEIGDEVVPMVYGANGQDRPMSLYQDGSPKVFKVLGTNIYYDGAVWQELSLQEVAQKV